MPTEFDAIDTEIARRDVEEPFAEEVGPKLYIDREAFLNDLRRIAKESGVRLSVPELKAVVNALSERDEAAEVLF